MSNFLNQDFGSDDEDDEFNPGPVDESEGEDSKVSYNQRAVSVESSANGTIMNSRPSPTEVALISPTM